VLFAPATAATPAALAPLCPSLREAEARG
jgi:hypothetical protein